MASQLWPTIEDRKAGAVDLLSILDDIDALRVRLDEAKEILASMTNPYDLGSYATIVSLASINIKDLSLETDDFLQAIQNKIDANN
jgi:hypothetical protein